MSPMLLFVCMGCMLAAVGTTLKVNRGKKFSAVPFSSASSFFVCKSQEPPWDYSSGSKGEWPRGDAALTCRP